MVTTPYSLSPRFSLKIAKKEAGTSGKRVAVIFGANWCPDSGALNTTLEHPLVKPLVEPAFEVVKVDVGNRDKNLGLAAELGIDPARGIPALAVLESDGTVVASLNDGELATARGLSPLEVATIFHRLAGDEAKAKLPGAEDE